MILVDTSVWVDFLRGEDSPQRRVLHRLIEDEEDISMTEIIFTEILQGIKNDREFQAIKDYLLDFPLYRPKGIETYLHAALIYRDCRKKGKTVRRTVDCIIAAICIEHDLTLFHKDSDFDLIEACTGLQVIEA
ncbi:pilus biogenesis protein [Candidatus Methylomirabilis lanthanidiphila]|uniref:Ribonuclease VapC n=1 Tax=Candidatus Methylomirabilis lanthanidiphila TaxID=2211376 RepID=A0A564ZG31_9BACT|nr:PIN domain nuclease [Candidatus Methylomirabilis lanthanidiphila]VUZ84244.1 pilus biogenesis protein [Candidatus Methylomirabilis lanthanidiphila]